MSDPPIPELPPDIEALLREARGVPEAPSSERRKVAARLALTTGLMIPSATLAGAKLAASSWAVKALGVALLVAAGAGAVAVATTQAPAPRAHARTTTTIPITAPRFIATAAPATAVSPAPPTAIATASAPTAAPTTPPVPAPPPRHHTPRGDSDDGLADEVLLIQQARDALARGDERRARAALAAHAQDFPRGHLQPEREALRVRALAESGDHDGAEAARRRFHERFPDSVLGVAVDRAVDAAR